MSHLYFASGEIVAVVSGFDIALLGLEITHVFETPRSGRTRFATS